MFVRALARLVCALVILQCGGHVSAQFTPAAPVEDFTLFGFDEVTGFRIWELQGSEGRYIGPDHIQIETMRLQTFSATESQEPQFRIESPLADMFPKLMKAEGETGIAVTGPRFFLTGLEWEWYAKDELLKVYKNVRVTFQGEIGELIQ